LGEREKKEKSLSWNSGEHRMVFVAVHSDPVLVSALDANVMRVFRSLQPEPPKVSA
jgi:hypothetical protein